MSERRHHRPADLVGAVLFVVVSMLGPALAHPEPAGPATAGSGGWARVAAQDGYRAHDRLAPLRAEQAWQHSTGAGVTVAVLDSGVDAGHPDLAGRVLPGKDYVDGSTDGRVDPVGHGTTVASLIAGHASSATGLAPDARILPVRVLDEENRYREASTVADGVVWAVEHGAQVINLSLGGTRASPALREALELAMARDVVVVACTGNLTDDPDERVWYPAREPGVVAVAGLTFSGGAAARWPQSISGPETVLAAPAVMTGARVGGGHRDVQGTSFSSALVSATAALIRARWPELSAGDVVNRLVASADDLGPPGRDRSSGFGAVDAVGAVSDHIPLVHANPLDTRPGDRAGLGPARDRDQGVPSRPATGADQPAGGRPAGDEVATGGPAGRPPLGLVGGLLGGLTALVVAVLVGRVGRRSTPAGRP